MRHTLLTQKRVKPLIEQLMNKQPGGLYQSMRHPATGVMLHGDEVLGRAVEYSAIKAIPPSGADLDEMQTRKNIVEAAEKHIRQQLRIGECAIQYFTERDLEKAIDKIDVGAQCAGIPYVALKAKLPSSVVYLCAVQNLLWSAASRSKFRRCL